MGERIKITEKAPEARKKNSVFKASKSAISQFTNSPIDPIMFLQRTVGNQAVQRMTKSGTLQAKLRIGQLGDKYEQEADRIADQVMRMPEPRVQWQPEEKEEEDLQTKPLTEQITPLAQRQVEPEEEKEEEKGTPEEAPIEEEEEIPMLQRQLEEEEKEELQAKEIPGKTPGITPDLESHIHALKGGGQPLPESVRAFFEPRFGHDFSQVKVHTDSNAAEVARVVNAKAFTKGKDVVFGSGQYSPQTLKGKNLLAHELTHVVQQHRDSSIPGDLSAGGNLQRFSIRTTGTPPHGWRRVPRTETRWLREVKRLIQRVIRNGPCIRYFQSSCPGGTRTTARERYRAAQLWKHPSTASNEFGAGDISGNNISYTSYAYRMGVWTLAATIVHELMHNCGVEDEETCENALNPCGRLPTVPVGGRDAPIEFSPIEITVTSPIPGPRINFFKEEVRSLSSRPDLIFIWGVGSEPAFCFTRGSIAIYSEHRYWRTANRTDIRQLARRVVRSCFRR